MIWRDLASEPETLNSKLCRVVAEFKTYMVRVVAEFKSYMVRVVAEFKSYMVRVVAELQRRFRVIVIKGSYRWRCSYDTQHRARYPNRGALSTRARLREPLGNGFTPLGFRV